ncbi:hypothetical protein FACS1894133_3360 [Clostridia bacterium]|nr:hypothetical protein FACS1894133_3360 [Clostridia bacterium]
MEKSSLAQYETILYVEAYDGFINATDEQQQTLIGGLLSKLAAVGVNVGERHIKQRINAVHKWHQLNSQWLATADYLQKAGVDTYLDEICRIHCENADKFYGIKSDVYARVVSKSEPVLDDLFDVPPKAEPVVGDLFDVSSKVEPVVGDLFDVSPKAEPVVGDLFDVPPKAEPVVGDLFDVPANTFNTGENNAVPTAPPGGNSGLYSAVAGTEPSYDGNSGLYSAVAGTEPSYDGNSGLYSAVAGTEPSYDGNSGLYSAVAGTEPSYDGNSGLYSAVAGTEPSYGGNGGANSAVAGTFTQGTPALIREQQVVVEVSAAMSERQEEFFGVLDNEKDNFIKAGFYSGGGVLLLLVVYFVSSKLNFDIIDWWFFALISPFVAIFTLVKAIITIRRHNNNFVLCGEPASAQLSESIKKASAGAWISGAVISVMTVVFFAIAGNLPAERLFDYIDDVKTMPRYTGVNATIGNVLDRYVESPKWSEKRRTLFNKYIEGVDSAVAYVTLDGVLMGESVSFVYEIDNEVTDESLTSAVYNRNVKLYRVTYDGKRLKKDNADNFEKLLFAAYAEGSKSLDDYLYDNNLDESDVEEYIFD